MSLVNKVQSPARLSVWLDDAKLSTVRVRLVYVAKQLWLAYLAGAILILFGFFWGLPDGKYHGYSFQIDETAAVISVNHISFPNFDPQFYPWGTAVFYQVYLVKTIVTLAGRIHLDDYWIYVIGRAIVFASAMGAITAIFFLGRKLFDEWTGRLAAILFAILPGFVIPAHYFKMDVPMIFWMLASMLAVYQLLATKKLAHVIVLGLLVGYSTTVKYTALALVPAGLVAVSMLDRKFLLRNWLVYGVALAAGFVIGEPRVFWNLPDIVAAFGSLRHDAFSGLPYTIGRLPAWLDYPVTVAPYAFGWPMLILVIPAIIWGVVKLEKKWLPIWTLILFSWFLLSFDNLRLMRYLLPVLPFFVLLIAYWVSSLRKTRASRFIVPALSLAMLLTFVFSLAYAQAFGQTDPRVQAGQWVEQNIPSGEAIAVLGGHYANLPDLPLMGYGEIQADYSIARLQGNSSPYLIESEFGTRMHEQAIAFYPEEEKFFEYVRANYVVVAQFENSQSLFGIDSKVGDRMPQDWLHPNPKITIFKRRESQPQALNIR